jgi:hypothetical protein
VDGGRVKEQIHPNFDGEPKRCRVYGGHSKERLHMNQTRGYHPEKDPLLKLPPGMREGSKRLELLEILVDKIIKGLEDDSCRPRVRDALTAIQLMEKVAKSSQSEDIFWQMIDDIRKSEMFDPPTIEDQIEETILGLRHLVKNGVLQVKTIADAFNQNKSEQARLTYRRMGALLSGMGFIKAKTSNGCCAIIWDDNRLVDSPRKAAKRCAETEASDSDPLTPPAESTLSRPPAKPQSNTVGSWGYTLPPAGGNASLCPPDKGETGGSGLSRCVTSCPKGVT